MTKIYLFRCKKCGAFTFEYEKDIVPGDGPFCARIEEDGTFCSGYTIYETEIYHYVTHSEEQ